MITFSFIKNNQLFVPVLIFGLLLAQYNVSGQMRFNKLKPQNNRISYHIDFNDYYSIKELNNTKFLDFENSLDENKPGSPVLPSKIIYLAIPPNSKVNIILSNQNFKLFTHTNIRVNPATFLANDSLISYRNQNLKPDYFNSSVYPSSQYKILGYTWIRDYYCAVIQINTGFYDWKTKEIKLLLGCDFSFDISGNSDFPLNNTKEGFYDKSLSRVILNYADAKIFRSFRKYYTPKDTSGNWINYSNQYVKFAVPNNGIYRIGYSDLVNYGLNPQQINPGTIKIYCKGYELPLYIKLKNPDVFSEGDYIEFWATKNYGSPNYREIVPTGSDYLNYMDRYTDTTFIWLTFGGINGRRMDVDSVNTSGIKDTLTSYLDKQHFEKDVRLWYYDSSDPRVQLPFWQENKVWTWSFWTANGSFILPFSASDIVPNTSFKTYVRLISNAADIQTAAHKVGIRINSTSILDSLTFDYKQTVNFNSTFSSGLLKEGDNTLSLLERPTNATIQQVLLDWIDIEYYRYLNASADSIYFKFPDSLTSKIRVIKIANITAAASDLILYKVNPDTVRMDNFILSGSSPANLYFVDTVAGGDAYVLISRNYLRTPVFEVKKQFVNLRNNQGGADDILISNKLLSASASAYNDFIKSNYGVRTDLVFVNDIYDEFSYGYPDPEAIRNFLIYAYNNWQLPHPSYLTLIGDANYDYKNLWSPVPTVRKMDLVPSYGYPVSDTWYCTWDSTQLDIPQMYIGRIPADNDAQVNFYLQKYKNYLARPYDDWNKKYLFFTGGDPSVPGQIDQLKEENDYVFNNLVKSKPVGGIGYHFYKTENPPTNFGPYSQNQISNAIDSGAVFISYIGHSGTQTWDNGITEVSNLKNLFADRFPLITDFGCSTGKFAEPDVNAFSELFLTESNDGQAICYLGNSSLGYISTSIRFPAYFYSLILQDSITNIAEAHVLAKIEQFQETGYSDVNRVFSYCNLLFGDPMLKLKIPPKPNLAISPDDIKPLNQNPTERDDYLPLKIYYHNYGTVPDDSVLISFNDILNNKIIYDQNFLVPVPLFTDSLTVNLPIKNLAGEHIITVVIDSANRIDEIYENDNTATLKINVNSVSMRNISGDDFYSVNSGVISLLNPVTDPGNGNRSFFVQLSSAEDFSSSMQQMNKLDTVTTNVNFSGLVPYKRYWWRFRTFNSSAWSSAYSFIYGNSGFNWLITNPADGTQDIQTLNAAYNSADSSWELSSLQNELKISSAGSSDGKFASILFNKTEMLPNTYFWGIATALIDTVTLKPFDIKFFTYPASQSGDSLNTYLKSLPSGTVLAMTVCDDAAQSVFGYPGGTAVRNEIKNWGSFYIDSVKYRESWCLLGKKGAAPGTVPEVYKKQFEGIARIDTVISLKYANGNILFPPIKNSGSWDSLRVQIEVPSGSTYELKPVCYDINNIPDTLGPLNILNGSVSLKQISAQKYHQIRILANLNANAGFDSPKINSLAVKYKQLPELGTNFQVVSISNDSIKVGQSENLDFYVYNVGGSPADSFKVEVEVINPDNSSQKIYESTVDSLNPSSKRFFNITYNSSQMTGKMTFYITIDPENKINELFKDNNFYSIPFYVKGDTSKPTLDITFDGKKIFDGEYVSSDPEIKIALSDMTLIPVRDTSSIKLYLNGNPVYLSNNKDIQYHFSEINPKFTVVYKPKLNDGEYELSVTAKNGLGTYADSAGLQKNFIVSNEAHILYVYNYPNPFKYDTYFTFKLTQIPDEVKIMIYTIAGRHIKTIKVYPGQLKYDMNKIYWDGRDADGDILANGVYLYKVIMKRGDKTESSIQKLAIIR